MQITNGVKGDDVEAARSGWFECSCCPTNMVRFLPSLPGYMYAQKGNNIYVNLFIAGNADIKLNNNDVKITQVNNYPWNGLLNFNIEPTSPANFNLLVRIPGWSRAEAIPSDLYAYENSRASKVIIKVNGRPVDYKIENGYAVIKKEWKKGDRLQMDLPMKVNKVIANHALKEDNNKVALQRGPVMYTAEWVDNNGRVSDLSIPRNATFTPQFDGGLLNGVTVLKGEVVRKDSLANGSSKVMLTVIPYYSWANRGKGEMQVWFPAVN